MFTSKGLFSQVECPYQETCLLPNCIFGHPKGPLSPTQIEVRNQTSINFDKGQYNEGQRKRQKLVDGDGKADTVDSITGTFNQSLHTKPLERLCRSSNGKPVPSPNSQPSLSSLNRPVSPPPLRRNAQNGTILTTEQSLIQNSDSDQRKHSSRVTSTPIKPIANRKIPIKASLKKEGLNPRVKVPAPATHDLRFRLLRAVYEQFNRLNSELEKDASEVEEELVLSEQELITKALDLEEDATNKGAIYSNVVKNKILMYKKMTVKQWKEERAQQVAKTKLLDAVSTSDTPTSKPTEPPKPIETGLTLQEELTLLPRLYTPISGLSKHGYVTSVPTPQEIQSATKGVETAKGWEVCDRCKNRFRVFPGRREEDGALTSGRTCTYHYGKPFWQERSVNDPKSKREKRYRCCGQAIGDSSGCTKGDCHVFKITEVKRLAAVLNFEKTPETLGRGPTNPVCIDGEMGYTVYGLELIRLTATSWPTGDELFDVLVRPVGEILDLNSRYSGVWAKDMAEAPPWSESTQLPQDTANTETNPKRKLPIVSSPAAARSLLFSHLSPNTPLIGHGLENDLNAIRLIHHTIIDTALLFPHKAGLPYRNALKMLMYTHLNRHIQVVVDGKMDGHDSKEDANAAGLLVRWKLGEEWARMKRDGWVLEESGVFKPPKGVPGLVEENKLEVLGSGAGKKRPREEMGGDINK